MKHKLVLQYPSSWWHDMWRKGLPVGNGFTGASLYGGSKREVLQLGRHDFWYDGDAGELPDVRDVNQLNQNGYKASLEAHIPLARMLITQKTEKGFKHFERGLDLEKALTYQQWSDNGIQMRREVFVSRAEDIVVYHLTADTEKGSDYHVELETYRNDGENVREAMQEIWDSEQKRVCIEGVQMAHPMPTTINSTIDLAILKEFFGNLLEFSEKSGCMEFPAETFFNLTSGG